MSQKWTSEMVIRHNLNVQASRAAKLASQLNEKNNPTVHPPQPEAAKSVAAPTLAGRVKRIPKRKGRVAVVVSIIDCRPTRLDADGNIGAQKFTRDAIAETLGVDDGDERVRWQYGECETRGEKGVIVKVEIL